MKKIIFIVEIILYFSIGISSLIFLYFYGLDYFAATIGLGAFVMNIFNRYEYIKRDDTIFEVECTHIYNGKPEDMLIESLSDDIIHDNSIGIHVVNNSKHPICIDRIILKQGDIESIIFEDKEYNDKVVFPNSKKTFKGNNSTAKCFNKNKDIECIVITDSGIKKSITIKADKNLKLSFVNNLA